jgi:hypothetical protein
MPCWPTASSFADHCPKDVLAVTTALRATQGDQTPAANYNDKNVTLACRLYAKTPGPDLTKHNVLTWQSHTLTR